MYVLLSDSWENQVFPSLFFGPTVIFRILLATFFEISDSIEPYTKFFLLHLRAEIHIESEPGMLLSRSRGRGHFVQKSFSLCAFWYRSSSKHAKQRETRKFNHLLTVYSV